MMPQQTIALILQSIITKQITLKFQCKKIQELRGIVWEIIHETDKRLYSKAFPSDEIEHDSKIPAFHIVKTMLKYRHRHKTISSLSKSRDDVVREGTWVQPLRGDRYLLSNDDDKFNILRSVFHRRTQVRIIIILLKLYMLEQTLWYLP